MSIFTEEDIPRLSTTRLSEILLDDKAPEKIAVVDDYFDSALQGLVRDVGQKEVVVFYSKSSDDGDAAAAALRYHEERQRLFEANEIEGANDGSQAVYILDGGFQDWETRFGKDKKLTESKRKGFWS